MLALGLRVAARGLLGIRTRVETDGAALTSVPIAVAASRDLNVGDNGALIVPSATLTLTIPEGLPDNFTCRVAATAGTTSVDPLGAATVNGAGTTVTRLFSTAANTEFKITKKGSAEDYVVTGV